MPNYNFGGTTPYSGAVYVPGQPSNSPTAYAPAPVKRYGALAPVYDANGLVTGYGAGTPGSPGTGSLAPTYGSTGLITGYGGLGGKYAPSTASGAATPQPTQPAGTQTGSQDPNSQFSLLDQTKSQPVAGAADTLQGDVNAAVQQESKNFQTYLKEAQQQQEQEGQQLQKDIATFTAAPSNLASELGAINTTYANTASGVNAAETAANTKYEANTQDILKQIQNEDAAYEQAALGVAAGEVGNANRQLEKYQLASGTPASGGSDLNNLYAQAYQNINVPLQQQLSQMRLGQLTGVALPLQQQYQANTTNQLNTMTLPIAGNIASMGSSAAQLVSGLQTALAGRSMNEAQQYMQLLGLPFGVQQQLLSGQISLEQALSSLNLGNTFYGLATNYTQPNIYLPNYNNPVSRGASPVAPVTVGATTPAGPDVAVGAVPLGGNRPGTYGPSAGANPINYQPWLNATPGAGSSYAPVGGLLGAVGGANPGVPSPFVPNSGYMPNGQMTPEDYAAYIAG